MNYRQNSEETLRLDALQNKISEWAESTFPHHDENTIITHLLREVNELRERGTLEEAADCGILLLTYIARQRQRMSDYLNEYPGSPWRLATDTLDGPGLLRKIVRNANALDDKRVLWLAGASYYALQRYARLQNALVKEALEDAIEAKHKVNLQRNWTARPDAEGVVEHVR